MGFFSIMNRASLSRACFPAKYDRIRLKAGGRRGVGDSGRGGIEEFEALKIFQDKKGSKYEFENHIRINYISCPVQPIRGRYLTSDASNS